MTDDLYKENCKNLFLTNKLRLALKKTDYKNNLINLIKARDNYFTTKIKNSFLYSKYYPFKTVIQQLENIPEANLFIFSGFGLGYELLNIQEKFPTQKKLVLIVNTAFFKQVISQITFPELWHNPNITFALYEPSDLDELFTTFSKEIRKGYRLITNSALSKIYQEERLNIQKQLDFIFRSANSAIITNLINPQRYVTNLVFNASYWDDSSSFNNLKNLFNQKPAICIAAGPSLTKNIQHLKEPSVREKIILIVVDTSIPVLLSHNIYPDLIIAADAGLGNLRHFEQYLPKLANIPAIFDPMVSTHLIKAYPGPFMFYPISNSYYTYITEAPDINFYRGITVSTIAVSIASHLGCSPIILMGCDFSFAHNSSYANGTAKKKSKFSIMPDGTKFKQEVDIYGKTVKLPCRIIKDIENKDVYTDEVLFGFLQDMNNFIHLHPNKYLDATEGGAKIEGAIIAPIKSVLAEIRYQFRKPLNKHNLLKIIKEKNINDIKIKVQKIFQEIISIKKLTKTGQDLLHKVTETDLNKLQQLNNLIDSIYNSKAGFDFIKQLMTAEILTIEDNSISFSQKINNLKIFFTGLEKGANFLYFLLKAELAIIEKKVLNTAKICSVCKEPNPLPISQFQENSLNILNNDYDYLLTNPLTICRKCLAIVQDRKKPKDLFSIKYEIFNFIDWEIKADIISNIIIPSTIKKTKYWKKLKDYNQKTIINFSFDLHFFLNEIYIYLEKLAAGSLCFLQIFDSGISIDPVNTTRFPKKFKYYFTETTIKNLLSQMGLLIKSLERYNQYILIIAQKNKPSHLIRSNVLDITNEFRDLNEYEKHICKAAWFFQGKQIEVAGNFLEHARQLLPIQPSAYLYEYLFLSQLKQLSEIKDKKIKNKLSYFHFIKK